MLRRVSTCRIGLLCMLTVLSGLGLHAQQANIAQGRMQYMHRCEMCHDTDAAGDGPLHTMFIPQPANLTATRDTKAMMSSIIKNGLEGTAMPAHRFLNGDQINNIIAFIQTQPLDTAQEWEYAWELQGNPPPPNMGRDVYVTTCAGCHGVNGEGRTAYADNDSHFWPKPSNFYARNSQIGRNYNFIKNGIDGTMMPPQQDKLPMQAMWALAQYVTGMFNPNDKTTIPTGKMAFYKNPYQRDDMTQVDVGKETVNLYCVACHGGEAEGTFLAPKLVDRKWRYEGGSDNGIFMVVTKGIPGKLMPPHPQLAEDRRWAAITYLRYHGGLPDPLASSGGPRRVAFVSMQNLRFVPRDLFIEPGTTVIWRNNDQVVHTATANGWQMMQPVSGQLANLWNSGPLDPNRAYGVTFVNPGTSVYHCMVHPYMVGTVNVAASVGDPGTVLPPVADDAPNRSLTMAVSMAAVGIVLAVWGARWRRRRRLV